MNDPSAPAGSLVLPPSTARDLMVTNPISISETAGVGDASRLLSARGFSAAPVIDEAGRPVGVISKTDIVAQVRPPVHRTCELPEYYLKSDLTALPAAEGAEEQVATGSNEGPRVRDIMTPAVFSVTPETSARAVVEQLLALNVHRLFVVDRAGVLVGVISALDILRRLQPLGPEGRP
ncbi:MAG: CBS domain-containing protein [Gemmataceae bacterium]|nr:CBS domain-containing protein [Gemmataceae bacterium]